MGDAFEANITICVTISGIGIGGERCTLIALCKSGESKICSERQLNSIRWLIMDPNFNVSSSKQDMSPLDDYVATLTNYGSAIAQGLLWMAINFINLISGTTPRSK